MTQPAPAGENEKFWSRIAGKYDSGVLKVRGYDAMIGRTVREISGARRVIEIAAGTGMISLGAAPFVDRIDAFDLAPGMVEVARKNAEAKGISNIRFRVGSAYRLEAEGGAYDAAVISNALHIMEKPETALGEIVRVLKEDGRLIAPTFLHGHSLKAQLISRAMSAFSGFKVFHRWDPGTFQAMIESNGFDLETLDLIPMPIPLAFLVARKGPTAP